VVASQFVRTYTFALPHPVRAAPAPRASVQLPLPPALRDAAHSLPGGELALAAALAVGAALVAASLHALRTRLRPVPPSPWPPGDAPAPPLAAAWGARAPAGDEDGVSWSARSRRRLASSQAAAAAAQAAAAPPRPPPRPLAPSAPAAQLSKEELRRRMGLGRVPLSSAMEAGPAAMAALTDTDAPATSAQAALAAAQAAGAKRRADAAASLARAEAAAAAELQRRAEADAAEATQRQQAQAAQAAAAAAAAAAEQLRVRQAAEVARAQEAAAAAAAAQAEAAAGARLDDVARRLRERAERRIATRRGLDAHKRGPPLGGGPAR